MSDRSPRPVPATRGQFFVGPRPEREFASIVGWSFALLKRRFAGIVLGSAVYLGTGYVLIGGLLFVAAVVFTLARGEDTFAGDAFLPVGAALFGVLGLLLTATLGGALAALTFSELDGRPVSLFAAVRQALRRAHVLFAVHVAYLIACAVGTVLLVAPGVFAGAYGFGALPVCLRERCGPLRAVSRSIELAQESVGRAVGLALISVGIYFAAGVIGQCVMGVALVPLALAGATNTGAGAQNPVAFLSVAALAYLVQLLCQLAAMCWIGIASAAYVVAVGESPTGPVEETAATFE